MSLIEYKGNKYKPCPYCKGKGYKNGYEHVRNGICFQCEGYKSVEIFNLIEKTRKEIKKEKEVEYRYSEIKRLRRLLGGKTEGDMKAIDKSRLSLLKRNEEALIRQGIPLPEKCQDE